MFNDEYRKAHALYVFSGADLSLEDVAKETGISASKLKRWSTKDGWNEEKKAHQEFLVKRSEAQRSLQLRTLEVALKADDPNDLYKLMNSLIGQQKVDLIRQKMIEDMSAAPVPDKDMIKQIGTRVLESLMKKFDML